MKSLDLIQMKLTEEQIAVLESRNHILVTGGPGSGKTTIAILKAAQLVEDLIHPEQGILFLSFARATVSRILEAIQTEQSISKQIKRKIEVETYHSFFWRIIKAYGHLIGLPTNLYVLAPPEEAVRLSTLRAEDQDVKNEIHRLAYQEGKISFSLFAEIVDKLVCISERILTLIENKYPYIILDEFQDTNKEQWNLIKALGRKITLISLADPEQRIYGWLGADPERINNFIEAFSPTQFSLKSSNHRSSGTDILNFGNDVLSGKFTKKNYIGIDFLTYPANEAQAFSTLITIVYQARKRLYKNQKEWSLAILAPTKLLARVISDKLSVPPAGMKPLQHTAIVDLEAIVLSAEIIAFLLQPFENEEHFGELISLMINYYQGKNGDSPTKSDLGTAQSIENSFLKWKDNITENKKTGKSSIAAKVYVVLTEISKIKLSGNVENDWITVRKAVENGVCRQLLPVADDVKNLRLLRRGTELRAQLSANWIETGSYNDALSIIRQAFIREHFSTTQKVETGITVMNMHKAKGKQFDEVIIFEGWPRVVKGEIVANANRFVRNNAPQYINDQNMQNLRVSITRGKKRVTILTPKIDRCVLFTKARHQ